MNLPHPEPLDRKIERRVDVLVRAIVGSQAILAQHLEPQGMSADQTVALLFGVLDHEEAVRAVAETVRVPQAA